MMDDNMDPYRGIRDIIDWSSTGRFHWRIYLYNPGHSTLFLRVVNVDTEEAGYFTFQNVAYMDAPIRWRSRTPFRVGTTDEFESLCREMQLHPEPGNPPFGIDPLQFLLLQDFAKEDNRTGCVKLVVGNAIYTTEISGTVSRGVPFL